LPAAAKTLGSALDEPEQALERLEEAGLRFSEKQKEQIEQLADSGRVFEAHKAILDAVADSVGGADAAAHQGLTGGIRAMTQAWDAFVADFGRSDSVIGQTAAHIVTAITGIINAVHEASDLSLNAQLTRLTTERDVLAMQLQSDDFGAQSWWPWSETNAARLKQQAQTRLEEINHLLADLQARQDQQDLADAIAREDQENAIREQSARTLAGKLEEIDQELDDKISSFSEDRIAKIHAEAAAKIRVIEGLKSQATALGQDTTDYDAAVTKVRAWETAALAAAETATESADDAIDDNQRLIESLEHERQALTLNDRERAIDTALRRLSAEATDAQKDKVRDLAGAIYDEKQAIEATAKAEQVLGNLRRQLADLTLNPGDRAAAEAVRQLGDNAKEADRAMASLLAHQLQDGRDAKAVIDSLKDGATLYQEELAKLNHLLEVGALSHDQFAEAADRAYARMLEDADSWEAGVERAWRKWSDAASDSAAQAERVFGDAMKGMEDVFARFVVKGELNFDQLTDRILEDLARIFWERQVMGPIGDALFGGDDGEGLFGSLFGSLFADGAAFEHGRVTAFASGTVIDRPTLFPMATGVGLMGEAGPEGILPLQRTADGRLGVAAIGGEAPSYVLNIDARGATDPAAVATQVEAAVATAMARAVPGIVRSAAGTAYGAVVDQFQRRGGRFT
jgi:lambda family phage tail tape measure protein